MSDPTYETKASREVDAIYEAEYAAADRDLRKGKMSVAFEMHNNSDELCDRFSDLASQHYRRELTPEQLANQLTTLLCDLVSEVAEWSAERKR